MAGREPRDVASVRHLDRVEQRVEKNGRWPATHWTNFILIFAGVR